MNDESLAADQELTALAIERIAVAIYCICNGRFAYVNARFANALGYSKEEILAFDSVVHVLPDDQHPMIHEILRRREAGETADLRFSTTARCKDGTLLETEVHGSVGTLRGERVLIGAAVDMTQQVESSRRLQEREAYFRALTENVSDIIVILDGHGVISHLSPSAERILDRRPEEHVGMTAFDWIHLEDRQRLSHALERLGARESVGPVDCRVRHADGTWRVMELVGSNLLHDQTIRGLVLRLCDVTDRRRMEQEVEQLRRWTCLGRLAAQVAHEFNNVLMGIQPMADVLRRRIQNPDLRLQIDSIAESVARGKRITTDILRFARPAQLSTAPVRAGDLLDTVSYDIRPMLPENVRLTVDVSDDLLLSADRPQLSQVLMNLALNARDAMPVGGTLTLAAELDEGAERDRPFVRFAITDTGVGIAEEDLPYIFEPLFTTKKSGTGLGLSVVYQIVTLHEGRISVESEPGKGTTFHLWIPAVTEHHDAVEPRTNERYRPDWHRLLLVEDDEAIALGLSLSLEEEGLDVHAVGRGADVLPELEAFDPDVVVLDLSLPDADGRDVYAEISRRSSIPVVFSSGQATESEIATMVAPGRSAFLMKPYSTDELLSTIRSLRSASEDRS